MKRALLTGTFDPPTDGHFKLIERAAAICEQLTVGIGENTNKPAPVLTSLERIEAIKKEVSSLSNVDVVSFSGLAIDYAKELGASVLIRGLRSSGDLDYEMQMALANQKIGGIETFFLMAEDPHISSTLIRELAAHGAPLNKILPQHVVQLFQHRLQKGK